MARTRRRGWNVASRDYEFEHRVARDSSCRPGCATCGKSRESKRQEKVARRRAGRAEADRQSLDELLEDHDVRAEMDATEMDAMRYPA